VWERMSPNSPPLPLLFSLPSPPFPTFPLPILFSPPPPFLFSRSPPPSFSLFPLSSPYSFFSFQLPFLSHFLLPPPLPYLPSLFLLSPFPTPFFFFSYPPAPSSLSSPLLFSFYFSSPVFFPQAPFTTDPESSPQLALLWRERDVRPYPNVSPALFVSVALSPKSAHATRAEILALPRRVETPQVLLLTLRRPSSRRIRFTHLYVRTLLDVTSGVSPQSGTRFPSPELPERAPHLSPPWKACRWFPIFPPLAPVHPSRTTPAGDPGYDSAFVADVFPHTRW